MMKMKGKRRLKLRPRKQKKNPALMKTPNPMMKMRATILMTRMKKRKENLKLKKTRKRPWMLTMISKLQTIKHQTILSTKAKQIRALRVVANSMSKCLEFRLEHQYKNLKISFKVEHSLNSDGRNSGHAFAAFASEQGAEQAMLKDRQYMGPRYVSLSRSDTFGTSQYTGQYAPKAKGFDGNFSEFCVKLSGVPFKTTEQEVKDFFKGGDAPTKIQTIMNEEGRSSGEMLADFASEEAVQQALLKDR